MITVYKYGTFNSVRLAIDPDDSSVRSKALMGENILTLNFSLKNFIQFSIGDFCTFAGELYQVNTLPETTKTDESGTLQINYVLQLESEMYDLGKVQLIFLNQNNVFTTPIFPFRGKPKDYGDLLIYNMLRVYPDAPWKLGNVVDGDFVSQDFNGNNCLEALKTIANIFQTEYIVDSKTINIYQRINDSGIVMQYGKNKAWTSLNQKNADNSNIITRLYAYGSTRNIPGTYRNGAQRLQIGDLSYVEQNIALYKIQEATVVFDGTTTDPKTGFALPEIYPHRTGIVSAVDDDLNFYDADIDFNVNDFLIPGTNAQIVFNTGLLAGYTFDINTYDDGTKKFTINQNTDEPNLIVPTPEILMAIGDSYVIINIIMPDSYVTDAEAQLRTAALNYIAENGIPSPAFTMGANQKYFRDNNIQLQLANTVTIIDADMKISKKTRITSFTQNVRNIFDYSSLTYADTVKQNNIIVNLLNGL